MEVDEGVNGTGTGHGGAALAARGPLCSAKAKNGGPCRATPTSTGACFWHSESISREQKLAAATRGGRMNAKKLAALDIPVPDLSTADACREFLQGIIARVANRTMPPAVASVVLQGVNLAVKIGELKLDAQLTAMLADAEEQAAKLGKGPVVEVREP